MRQSRLKKIFLEAAALPESDRLPMLERECAGDRALLADARALLAADIRGDGSGEEGELTRWLAGAIPDHAWDELSGLGDTRPPKQPRQLRTSDMVGKYTITRILGAGGSSSVYEAVRPGLDRPVALKVMHHALASDHDRWRFEHEVRALSRLDHPSVARVLDFGIAQDERPFIVTERIGSGGGEGQAVPFARAARPLSIPARLSMILTLCDAVSHAHQRGVIHRDLKSANVLVATDENGTRRPVIVDFGIARSFTPSGKGEPRTASRERGKTEAAEAQSSPHRSDSPAEVRGPRESFPAPPTIYTTPGLVIGTVGTMAPEQASGDPDAVDTRTDVWGLGVLLFESLTGELPHGMPGPGPGGMASWLSRVQQAECRGVRSLDPTIAPDLDAIVSKALSSEREGRYVSAAALAQDLRRYVAGEPTLARPVTALERAWKWTRRHKKSVATGAAVLVMAAAAVDATVRAISAERRERESLVESYSYLLDGLVTDAVTKTATRDFRRRIAGDAVEGLGRVIEEHPGDHGLAALYAKALQSLGDLSTEDGDLSSALVAQQRSLQAWEEVLRLGPRSLEHRRAAATQRVRVGDVLLRQGDFAAAKAHYTQSQHEYELLLEESPDHEGLLDDLAWGCERLIAMNGDDPLVRSALLTQRLDYCRRVVQIVGEGKRAIGARHSLADALVQLSMNTSDKDLHRGLVDEAIVHTRAIIAVEPNNRFFQRVHTLTLIAMARSSLLAGDVDQAIDGAFVALAHAEERLAIDSADPAAQTALAAVGSSAMHWFMAAERAEISRTFAARVVDRLGSSTVSDPDVRYTLEAARRSLGLPPR